MSTSQGAQSVSPFFNRSDIAEVTPAIKKLDAAKDPKQVTEEEWRKVLSPDEFNVTREAGTEPAYSGKYDKFFTPGKYSCICCGADLFL